jgi:beta-xylosidase
MQRRFTLLLCALFAGASFCAFAQGSRSVTSYVAPTHRTGAFLLSEPGRSAPLCVSSHDYPGVLRVVRLLQEDIGTVTGFAPSVVVDSLSSGTEMVLVGTLGRNPHIDRLVAEKKLDVEGIAGKWETFLIGQVEKPFPGIDRVLVIVGSDKRGTIYGMFDLSAHIGVSPWYWWADVAPRKQSHLYVLAGRHTAGEPKVKYRGFFINDEAPALSAWAKEKFDGFNSRFYDRVFELLLRLRANYLWPAMWGSAFYDDDPESPRLADEYGIVIGTSHHEPMMRAHDEWRRYGSGPWDYTKNDSTLRDFWRRGIQRMGANESVVTVGMRGDGDAPMSDKADIGLLERIVGDQRKILAEVTGKDPSRIPQLWALYKEVQEYYDRGMRVPDDVTLLLCDDNWGNLRKLPSLAEKPRAGGYGIYYHFDYVGGPRNYKWLNTIQISRVWEQMRLAYEHNARQIWIVNVGDIKPLEFPTQFFLDYAWNPERWSAGRLPEYTRLWAEQQFGPRYAAEIAEILTKYTTYNSRRKPELLSPETYSLVSFREAETVVEEYNALAEKARSVQKSLPAEMQDAYYQLVLHPVLACANLNEMYVTVGRNHLYARQGRASTNLLAARARSLFEKDSALSYYYNRVLAGGKWNHMMDQTHISYTTWQQPDRDVMPDVRTISLGNEPVMGVAIEGSEGCWPGDTVAAVLPEFDPYNRQSRYIDVFNRGTWTFPYALEAPAFIKIDLPKGTVESEQRIKVSVDWQKAPRGRSTIPITISGPHNRRVIVRAVVNNHLSPKREEVNGFVESNGYISIEAEHFSEAADSLPLFWQRIPDLGRTLSAMTSMPVTSPPVTPGGASPHLEYRVHFFTSGRVKVHAYFSPTLDFRGETQRSGGGLRYAVSFDGGEPHEVNILKNDTIPDWKYPWGWMKAVGENIRIATSDHTLESPGEHTLKFWMVDAGVVLQKLVIETAPLKRSYLGPPESYHRIEKRKEKVTMGFTNPILAGFYPDPSICRVDSDYYLVTSTFSYFPGLPVFQSQDLVNWRLLGHVMDRGSQLNLDGQGVSHGLFAPSIRFHNGVFYVTCTLVVIGGNFVVTAESPRGPWSDPVWIPEIDGIDPSLFFDENGKSYIIYNCVAPDNKPLYEGHRTIRMREFDTKALRVVGEEILLVNGGTDISKKPVWIEGPHIFKKDGVYYLIAAEGGTGDQHSEVVFRSPGVTGPYVPYAGNPILTQRHLDPSRSAPITSVGHADIFQTASGDWWAVFLGCRPYPPVEGGYYNTGRETYLAPVRWTNGWPVITQGDEKIQYHYRKPFRSSIVVPGHYSGNFTVRDDFTNEALDPDWVFLRTPHERWYDLTKGYLVLKLLPETCAGKLNPAFLGHRQQHLHGAASIALAFSARAENEKAGLLIFQNEAHFYFLCKSVTEGRPAVQLYRSAGKDSENQMELLASGRLNNVMESEELQLKIEAHGGSYAFLYRLGSGEWAVLQEGVDAKFLSTKIAGGFVGCMYALYATSLGQSSTNRAYFDWFEYSGEDEVCESEF